MLNPNTTSNVPIHFPNINPPSNAIGDPNPKKGNTQRIVNIKKIIDTKNRFELLNSRKYKLFSLMKSQDAISLRLKFEKKKNKKVPNKTSTIE